MTIYYAQICLGQMVIDDSFLGRALLVPATARRAFLYLETNHAYSR